jgi:hypothetical protein
MPYTFAGAPLMGEPIPLAYETQDAMKKEYETRAAEIAEARGPVKGAEFRLGV